MSMISCPKKREMIWVLSAAAVAVSLALPFGFGFGQRMADANSELTQELTWAFYLFGAVNNGPGGMIIYDDPGDLIYASDGIERITGWSLSELVGRDDRLIILPQTAKDAIYASGGMSDRIFLGPNSGAKLVTRDGVEVPIYITAWDYRWNGMERWAFEIVPANHLVEIRATK